MSHASLTGPFNTECTLSLPPNFRPADALSFHGRDTLSTAESVRGHVIRKGMVLGGYAAVIQITLEGSRALCHLEVDGPADTLSTLELEGLTKRLLGLYIDIDAFELQHAMHRELGALILAQSGLRIPMAGTPFEALIWAVTGQQINVGVASQLRRRLILLGGLQHSSGLWCHPDAQGVACLQEQQLRDAKFSIAKTQTILGISRMVVEGQLPLEAWLRGTLDLDAMRGCLLAIKGVGPWTVNYALLRGFGHADGSLHGDVAVRNALQTLLSSAGKPSLGLTEVWLSQFAPWRSLVAAHLWASLSVAQA